MNDTSPSEEQLNAFVDGELNAADRERILTLMRRDPSLQRRVASLVQTRDLLRHAYALPPAPVRRDAPRHRMSYSFAAFVLLFFGVGLGWWGRNEWQPLQSAPMAHAPSHGIVIQISEADPVKWNLALINARNVRKTYHDDSVGVEVVAYGPGLNMFHSDSSASQGMQELSRDGVKFLACGNTMRMTGTTRDQLGPAVEIVPAGVIEIMERQRDGYAYIRP